MTNTDQSTAAPSITSAIAPRLIGISFTVPKWCAWIVGGPEVRMLERLLTVALETRGLLIAAESERGNTQGIILAVFERQVYGHAPVTRIGPAASAIAEELSAIGLAEGLHLAWQDAAEGIWRTERPLPEPTPFQVHTEAFLAWRKACKAETPESRAAKIRQSLSDLSNFLQTLKQPPAPPAPFGSRLHSNAAGAA